MRTSYQRRLIEEYKRNVLILNDILLIVDIKRIKHHMKLLNKYTHHIRFELFSNLSVVRCYGLNNIQLRVLYNNLLFNGYIK